MVEKVRWTRLCQKGPAEPRCYLPKPVLPSLSEVFPWHEQTEYADPRLLTRKWLPRQLGGRLRSKLLLWALWFTA